MGKFLPKAPKPQGPSPEQLKAQRESAAAAKRGEERTNKQLSSAARFAKGRRTGRRLLLAPGREDEIAQLGGGSASTGQGNF